MAHTLTLRSSIIFGLVDENSENSEKESIIFKHLFIVDKVDVLI